jgi:hypothetical protein
MKFRQFRLMSATADAGGTDTGAPTTDGANTTPAALSSASTLLTDVAAPAGTDAKSVEATQQTPADAVATAAKPDEVAKAAEKAAPEKYEFKAPEGVTLDVELLGEFEGIAKELKLSQEDAQKVADLGAKLAQKFGTQQAAVAEQAKADWAAAATADTEFGGDKLTDNLAVAGKALDAFGTPAFKALLVESGLGNHPEVIRVLYRAGKAISEDRMVTGGAGPATAAQTTAKALYPNQS